MALRAQGQTDMFRWIVVNATAANQVGDAHSTWADYIDVSLTQLKQMRWRMADGQGRTASLMIHGISFSVVFMAWTTQSSNHNTIH